VRRRAITVVLAALLLSGSMTAIVLRETEKPAHAYDFWGCTAYGLSSAGLLWWAPEGWWAAVPASVYEMINHCSDTPDFHMECPEGFDGPYFADNPDNPVVCYDWSSGSWIHPSIFTSDDQYVYEEYYSGGGYGGGGGGSWGGGDTGGGGGSW
jgi:uncharacterized membrane protein YgcG